MDGRAAEHLRQVDDGVPRHRERQPRLTRAGILDANDHERAGI
jgi:hypothetical protein